MQIDNNTLLLLFSMVGMFIFMKFLPRWLAGVPFVPVHELRDAMEGKQDVLVIDVRTPREYTESMGHIKGSVNIPVDEVKARADSIKNNLGDFADTPVYVLCRTTNRSPHAAKWLRQAGLKNVKVVNGGMKKWTDAGFPTA